MHRAALRLTALVLTALCACADSVMPAPLPPCAFIDGGCAPTHDGAVCCPLAAVALVPDAGCGAFQTVGCYASAGLRCALPTPSRGECWWADHWTQDFGCAFTEGPIPAQGEAVGAHRCTPDEATLCTEYGWTVTVPCR